MNKNLYYLLGTILLLGVLALVVMSGIADFTTPLLDLMTNLLNENSRIQTSMRTLNNTGFWTGLYLQLVIDTWLFSSNWWIVLLSLAILAVCALWVANLILDKDVMNDICEGVFDSFDLKPTVKLGWLRFVYAAVGVYLSFNIDYDNAHINTCIVAASYFLTYLLMWNSESEWSALVALIPTTIIWLLGMFIAIVVASISWIAIILIIWGFFSFIFSLGSGGSSQSSSSSRPSDSFAWTGEIPNFRTDPTGTVGYDDDNNEYYMDSDGYWHRR